MWFALHADGSYQRLVLTEAGEAHFPAFHLPLERAVAGTDPELLVQALTTSVALSGVDRATLTFQLDQRFEGILKPTHLPFVRYRVTLTYEAPLGAHDSAPAVPAEERLLAPLERAAEPTAWEAGLVDVTPGPSAADYRATHRGERYDVSVWGANEAERLAATADGIHFEKHRDNPILRPHPDGLTALGISGVALVGISAGVDCDDNALNVPTQAKLGHVVLRPADR